MPGSSDHVIFDKNSLTEEFSLIRLDSDVHIQSLEINSPKFASFYGSNVNLILSGSLNIKSKAGFYLGGEIRFDNPDNDLVNITTNDIDFYTDLVFSAGNWEITGHLKTGKAYSISFENGSFLSNGFTVHAKNIWVNQNPYTLDFTGSHIFGIRKV